MLKDFLRATISQSNSGIFSIINWTYFMSIGRHCVLTSYVSRVFTRFAKQQEKKHTWHKWSHQLTTYLEIDYIYCFLIPPVQDKLVFQQQIFGMIPYQWYARNQNRIVSPKLGKVICLIRVAIFNNLVGAIVLLKSEILQKLHVKGIGKNLLVTYNNENQK